MQKTGKFTAVFAAFVILTVTACGGGDENGNTGPKTDAERPSITVQPSGGAYLPGATITPLSVTASVSDGGSLSYQWYSKSSPNAGGTAIGQETNDSFTPTVSAAGTMYYSLSLPTPTAA